MSGDELRQALQAAVRLLATREHSRKELERKLGRHHDSEVVARALDRLAGEGLQSDARFAEAYLRSRMEKGFGPLRIRAELRERGVDDTLIEAVLEPSDPRWRQRLAELARRKFSDRPPTDRRDLARRARFLTGRGFPEHLIRELLLDP